MWMSSSFAPAQDHANAEAADTMVSLGHMNMTIQCFQDFLFGVDD